MKTTFDTIIGDNYSLMQVTNWRFFANDMFNARIILPWEAVDYEYESLREEYFRYEY